MKSKGQLATGCRPEKTPLGHCINYWLWHRCDQTGYGRATDLKEYIEREQAIALFYPVDPENDGSDECTIVYKSGNFSSSEIEAMLSDLPAADVAEVRHGKIIETIKDGKMN